jgi:hypothetical protein
MNVVCVRHGALCVWIFVMFYSVLQSCVCDSYEHHVNVEVRKTFEAERAREAPRTKLCYIT